MKNLLLILISVFSISAFSLSSIAEPELHLLADGDLATGTTDRLTVPAGHTATITATLTGTTAQLRLDSIKLTTLPAQPITVPAGVQIRVYASSTETGSLAFAQISIQAIDTGSQYLPINTVVIPTDATGPIQIHLESSTDLINWSSAQPGTYGTSTAKRFFRVRAAIQ